MTFDVSLMYSGFDLPNWMLFVYAVFLLAYSWRFHTAERIEHSERDQYPDD